MSDTGADGSVGMYRSRSRGVPRDAFEELRRGSLGLVDSLGISAEARFAQVASWAVWAAPVTVGESSRARHGNALPSSSLRGDAAHSRDLSVLASYEVLAPHIHAEVIFVALNKGLSPVEVREEEDWATFHSGRRDFMLADAIRFGHGGMQHLWGAYMTDFYKGLPTRDGAELEAYLASPTTAPRSRIEEVMVELMHREMALLGAVDPLLVCLGRAVTQTVARLMPQTRRVSLTHYAAPITRESYRLEVGALCAQIDGPEL